MWKALFERTERGWCVVLLLFSIAAHAYSIAVTGAKYWIDSIAYFQLALVLFDAESSVNYTARSSASSISTLLPGCRF